MLFLNNPIIRQYRTLSRTITHYHATVIMASVNVIREPWGVEPLYSVAVTFSDSPIQYEPSDLIETVIETIGFDEYGIVHVTLDSTLVGNLLEMFGIPRGNTGFLRTLHAILDAATDTPQEKIAFEEEFSKAITDPTYELSQLYRCLFLNRPDARDYVTHAILRASSGHNIMYRQSIPWKCVDGPIQYVPHTNEFTPAEIMKRIMINDPNLHRF